MHVFKALWISISVALVLFAGGGPHYPDTDDPNTAGGDNSGSRAGVNLAQSIDTQDDVTGVSATISYPDSWFAEVIVEGMVIISNNPSLLTSSAEDVDPDDIPENTALLMIAFIPSEMFFIVEPDGSETEPSLIDSISAEAENWVYDESEIGEPREITVNGVTLARIDISTAISDDILLLSRLGETYVFAAGSVDPGKLGDYEDTFEAIAASVTVAANPIIETLR